MPTSSAISAATRSTPRRWSCSHELGLLDEFLKRPHDEVRQLTGAGSPNEQIDDRRSEPSRRCRAVHRDDAAMGFPRFRRARRPRHYPSFRLRMEAGHRASVDEQGASPASGSQTGEEIRARLTIAADGRASVLRDEACCRCKDLGAPIDVLWFRLPKEETRRPTRPARQVRRREDDREDRPRRLLAMRLSSSPRAPRSEYRGARNRRVPRRGRARPRPNSRRRRQLDDIGDRSSCSRSRSTG